VKLIPNCKQKIIKELPKVFYKYHLFLKFKEAILVLCKNNSLREKLGNNAKLKASQFDEELIFPKILQLYQRLLEKEGR